MSNKSGFRIRPGRADLKKLYSEQRENVIYRSSILMSEEKQQASKRYVDVRQSVKKRVLFERIEKLGLYLVYGVLGISVLFVVFYGLVSGGSFI